MKKTIILISFLVLCCCIVGTASASSQGGLVDGTYLIYDAEDLTGFATYINGDITHVTTNAKLMNDIDLTGKTWTPIGNAQKQYAGEFNGNGKSISNLHNIATFTYATNQIAWGLFGVINGATISNLQIKDFNIVSSSHASSDIFIGILYACGSSTKSTITKCWINNCYLTLTYSFGSYEGARVGGFGGYYGNVDFINCISNTMIDIESGSQYSNGVGFSPYIATGNIQNCYTLSSYLRANSGVAQGFGSITTGQFSNVVSIVNEYEGSRVINKIGSGAATFSNNYALNGGDSRSGQDGYSINTLQYNKKSFWDGTDLASTGIGVSWDFENIWDWNNSINLPELKIFQSAGLTIINLTLSGTLSGVNQPITGIVYTDSDNPFALSYNWSYSLDSGESWTNIYNQTQSFSFIPVSAGNYYFKVIISNGIGSVDSFIHGFTNTKVNVLNIYAPNSVDTKISSVQAKTLETYQATNEFDFSGNIYDVLYKGDTIAYVAAGNAIYEVDGTTATISALTAYTGNTINKAYFGKTRAIINDIDNNVAIYDYNNKTMTYIATNGSNKVAISPNYAYVVNDTGWLNIYNFKNQIVGNIQYTYPYLEVNQETEIFGYYIYVAGGESASNYFGYYTFDGTTITNKAYIYEDSFVSVLNHKAKPIDNTDKWVIYDDSIGYDIAIITIPYTGTGTTTVLMTTYYIVKNIDVSESLSFIFNKDQTIYVYGNDAQLQGSYTAGSNLNDVSIAHSNGLYAIAGGNDTIAYFINKESSSSWILGQATKFNENIYFSKISYDGNQALIGTTNKLFLFKYSESVESNYYINGVVVGSDGLPYANKIITIDATSVTTDDSGFFVYPVKPGQTYTIITGTKSTRYTATNQALQTLSIKIQSQLISQDVTYGAVYNQTSRNIEMTYNDAVDRTSIVVWSVRDTHTGQEVSRQTVQAGDPAFYFVPTGKENDNYFVTVNADRGNTTVKNTWSITPSGEGQTVNLFGMDETGRNILFGFFLILLAGLFGYLHQHIGTIIIAFAAAILRYLGLITVPWIMILIAVVVAIVAAIAHRGEGK